MNRDFVGYEYPATSVTILKFKDGRVGKVASVNDCLQPYYFRVHLVGSEGTRRTAFGVGSPSDPLDEARHALHRDFDLIQ